MWLPRSIRENQLLQYAETAILCWLRSCHVMPIPSQCDECCRYMHGSLLDPAGIRAKKWRSVRVSVSPLSLFFFQFCDRSEKLTCYTPMSWPISNMVRVWIPSGILFTLNVFHRAAMNLNVSDVFLSMAWLLPCEQLTRLLNSGFRSSSNTPHVAEHQKRLLQHPVTSLDGVLDLECYALFYHEILTIFNHLLESIIRHKP